jgi:pimeloyl-ACP methyl ester carboxylesterase
MQQRELTSFDGTRIVYEAGGQGELTLVVANGYGGSFWAWRDIFALLQDRYRLLIWDYRGLYRSHLPVDRARLRIEDHCRDLDAMLAAEGVSSPVALIGWSVGVQVALEQYRRRPESVAALLLINGVHGRVLHRSLDGRLAALLLRPGTSLLRRLVPVLRPALLPPLRALARSPRSVTVASWVGVVAGVPSAFHEALQAVLTLDHDLYLEMALLADEHDAEDVLPTVAVPTLVTAGDRDLITSTRVARHVALRIPRAEYFEIPGGTHYSVMEFPGLLANRISTFLQRRLA